MFFEEKGLRIKISGVVQEIIKVDACGNYCKRVMANSLKCSEYNSWMHARCAKIPKVSAKPTENFMSEMQKKHGLHRTICKIFMRWY